MLHAYKNIKQLIINILKKILPGFRQNRLIQTQNTVKKTLIAESSKESQRFKPTICKSLDEIPPDVVERLYFKGHSGRCESLVKVSFTGRIEKCRYCDGIVLAALHTDHIINRCRAKPKNAVRLICCPISGEPEWHWEKD